MGFSQGSTTKVSHTHDGVNKRDYLAVVSSVSADENTGEQDVTLAVFDPYNRETAVRNHRIVLPADADTTHVDLDYYAARAQVQTAPQAAAIVQAADPALVAAIAQQIIQQLQASPQGAGPVPPPAPAGQQAAGFPAPPVAPPAPPEPPAAPQGVDLSQIAPPTFPPAG
jgi:hypothetical protein